jgi:RNA-binding protein
MIPLNPRCRQFLKGKGHHLKPVIIIGKEGISEKVIAGTSKALLDHELIKVGILETALLDRKEAAADLAEKTGAELVQIVGFKLLLYKRHPKKPVLVLPE